MSINRLGVIGAGTMGNGIAQACAVSGIEVVMVDIAQAAVDKGLATVAGSLERLVKKEKMTDSDRNAAGD
jgi:3-hydroxybutyryl-CoA dehydrogenase